jgi:hypothetical protein
MSINHKEVIKFIHANLNSNVGDDELIKEIEAKFNLSDSGAGWAIEMFRTGY